MTEKRNNAIDFLRVIAIFFIMTVHFMGWGGVFENTNFKSLNTYWILPIYFLSQIGNTLFFLISGYYMKNMRLKKLFLLERKTAFYSIVSLIIMCTMGECILNWKQVVNCLFPVLFNEYWFITVYIILSVFSLVLFQGLETLEERSIQLIIVVLFINNTFIYDANMTFMQGLLAYVIGYYLRRFGFAIRCNRLKLGISFCVLFALYGIERLAMMYLNYEHTQLDKGLRYTLLLGIAIVFFSIIAGMKIKSNFFSRISPYIVAVYLITANPVLSTPLYTKWIPIISYVEKPWFILYYFGINLVLLSICIIIDMGVTRINIWELSVWQKLSSKRMEKREINVKDSI